MVASTGPPVTLNNFQDQQELLKRVASNLNLEAEQLKEPMDNLFDVLATVALDWVMLPVHEGELKVVKALWQSPSSLPSIQRGPKRICPG